jgi:hypothetical protein
MKTRTIASLAAAGLSLMAACGGPPTVTGPSATPSAAPSAPPDPAPAPVPSAASLVVSSFKLTFGEVFERSYWYRPAMTLTETSGKSAAMLRSISFSFGNGGSVVVANDAAPGKGCFLTDESKVVRAGASWDLASVYWYCLDIDSPADLSGGQISVTVSFTDEDGHVGIAKGTAIVK